MTTTTTTTTTKQTPHARERRWRKLRDQRITIARKNDELCAWCGGVVDYTLSGRNPRGPTAHHPIAIAAGGDVIVPLHDLQVMHQSCNIKADAERRRLLSSSGRPHVTPPPSRESPPNRAEPGTASGVSPTVAASHPDQFQSCPWLADLVSGLGPLDVWPRLMSAPHPRAVGSYGAEAVTRIEARRLGDPLVPDHEKGLRWFQKLALTRAYEHDDVGRLVWEVVVLTSNRQIGKSVLLRELCMDRPLFAGRLGEEQLTLHIARDLAVCEEVMRPGMNWGRMQRANGVPGFRVNSTNGKFELGQPGGRWLARSEKAAYGYSVSLGLADECWDISLDCVTNGLSKTQAARREPQLWLFSTSHETCTDLFPTYRNKAIAEAGSPKKTLLLEWSSAPDRDDKDEAGWREASPFYDTRRRELIAEDVGTPGFRQQWMNIWPAGAVEKAVGVPLVVEADWSALHDPGLQVPEDAVVGALEAVVGRPSAVAVAWRGPDSRIYVVGHLEPTLDAAWAALAHLPEGSSFVCGLSWRTDQRAADLGAEGFGVRETERALPTLAELVEAGAVVWSGDDLGDQVLGIRVVDSSSASGKTLVRSARPTHLARAAAWAVLRCTETAAPPVIW